MHDERRPATPQEVAGLMDPIREGAMASGDSMVVVFLRDKMVLAGLCDREFLVEPLAALERAYPDAVTVHWVVVDGEPRERQ